MKNEPRQSRHSSSLHRSAFWTPILVLIVGFLVLVSIDPFQVSGLAKNRAEIATIADSDEMLEPPTAPLPSLDKKENTDKRWGDITIGQPKIWQYERVNSLLDGLLRDVEGISVSDLTALNGNASNGAAVRFVQSMLEIGVKYDQAAAVTNSIALQNYKATQPIAQAQIKANGDYLQQLYAQRQNVAAQLITAQQKQSALQVQAATASGDALTTLQQQESAAASAISGFQQELSTINSQIAAATAAPSTLNTPTVSSTSAGQPPESANVFSPFLSSLPSGIQQDLVAQLQSPSLPATKQMDNFITLLYERLAREISALQDDLMRDPENVAFLVQFDVGLYPSKHSKNRVAGVEFSLDCDGCKVYSVYPGQSSYNLANYQGSSKRYSFWGNLLTLVGLGLSADYRRQEDELHGGLVQSVYTAGFQEGGSSKDRTRTHREQRFGWYFGSAPFEELVSPGIRSTFAIVTIPRIRLSNPESSNICIELKSRVGWVPRDNPTDSRESFSTVKTLDLTIPSAGAPYIPEVVSKEKDRLHVLGMEYNPVYEDLSSGFTSRRASSVPNGSVGGAQLGNATANSSTSQTASANAAPALDASTGCPPNQCAAVLIKLAEPIDPNLVVTVRGKPLQRVRDWRGRATSILPPVQAESDVSLPSSGATGSTPISRYENVSGRSLLEADQMAPNTWLEIDSHRLLLSISKELAGESEFPPIQIVVPSKRALFIPVDLDRGYTELVTNGFHLPVWDSRQLTRYACLHLASNGTDGFGKCMKNSPWMTGKLPDSQSGIRPVGPYPYATFLPLFLPGSPYRSIDAYVGETGVQILVTVKPAEDRFTVQPNYTPIKWLATHTQVILEDATLDLAWSLSCYPQEPYLACDFPQKELRDTYELLVQTCQSSTCPSVPHLVNDFPAVTSLQLWVEQYDPIGDDAFRTLVPARIGEFPVEAQHVPPEPDHGIADSDFSPWHFERAEPESVYVTGCRYPEANFSRGSLVKIFGQHIDQSFRFRTLSDARNSFGVAEPGCLSFDFPTAAFMHGEIVIAYNVGQATPQSLSTSSFKPRFDQPRLRVRRSRAKDGRQSIEGWDFILPASRVACGDRFDAPEIYQEFNAEWMVGGVPQGCQGADIARWDDASKNGRLELVLHVQRANLGLFSSLGRIRLVRGDDHIVVAELPFNLDSLVLPTRLTAKYLSGTQIELTGPNAEIIDDAIVSGPNVPKVARVSTAKGIALITLSVDKTASKSPAPAKPVVKSAAPTTGKEGASITIAGVGFGSSKGTIKFNDTIASTNCWTDINIGAKVPHIGSPGSSSIKVYSASGNLIGTTSFTVLEGTDSVPKKDAVCKNPSVQAAQSNQPKSNDTNTGLDPGTYSVRPLIHLNSDVSFPLDVTDSHGNGLSIVIPDPKKNDQTAPPDSPNGPTTTITITKKTVPPPKDTKPVAQTTPNGQKP